MNFPSESVAASWCDMRHGPDPDPDVLATTQAMSDLIERTWKQEREMGRDERRLMARYRKAEGLASAASLERYRSCSVCSGNPNMED